MLTLEFVMLFLVQETEIFSMTYYTPPPANEVFGYIGITLSVYPSRVNLTLAITFELKERAFSHACSLLQDLSVFTTNLE